MVSFKFSTYAIFVTMLCSSTISQITSSDKVDPETKRQLANGETPPVIVECQIPQPSTEPFIQIKHLLKQISEENESPATTRSSLLTQLVQNLQDTVITFLKDIIGLLKNLGVRFEVLWISFEIYILSASADLIGQIVQIGIVIKIRPDRLILQIPPQPPASQPPPQGNQTWNIDLIDARSKNITCLGENVTVGVIDTGARVTHQEIRDNWIGKNNTKYGFFDGNLKSCTPVDDAGHGTQVVSTVCGKTVGVAPKSKWFVCRACIPGVCPESSLKICMIWASCPYECGDTSENKPAKNCTLKPNVINNSWGESANQIRDEAFYMFYDYVKYWNSLGIISIFSAGNDGTGCNTIGNPGGYDNVIAVGAVDKYMTLADFSSVGPVLSSKPITNESIAVGTCSATTCGNPQNICALIKPNIVAPGVNITAAWNTSDTDYHILNGTSMATPHVTGVVALMICANPKVTWNYTVAYEILTKTTNTSSVDLLGERQNKGSPLIRTNLVCNVMTSNICNTYPNNMYGFGLTNACKAVIASKKIKP